MKRKEKNQRHISGITENTVYNEDDTFFCIYVFRFYNLVVAYLTTVNAVFGWNIRHSVETHKAERI